MKKKAQIQIFETIVVVFIFFILIAVGFVFYSKFIRGNIQTIGEQSAQSKSIAIAQRVMFLPELQCSEDNAIKDNCIDKLKLESAKNVMTANEVYYYDLFEFSEIKIKKIYPAEEPESTLYSRLPTTDYKNKFITNVPISIYDPSKKAYGFGILTIQTITK